VQPTLGSFFGAGKRKIAESVDQNGIRSCNTEKRGEGSFLKRIAQKVNCEGCNIGRANKLCVQKLCKQCCSASSEIEKCIAHKKSLVV
jgi:hypothetical protein